MAVGKNLKTVFSKIFSWLPAGEHGPEQAGETGTAKSLLPDLTLLLFIVDWNQVNIISGVLGKEHVCFHFISKARGTANSDILDLLGIGAEDKAVISCLEQQLRVPVLLREVRRGLNSSSPGAGIAFTVPLSGINNPLLRVFRQPDSKTTEARAEPTAPANSRGEGRAERSYSGHERRHSGRSYCLIMAVVNMGYSDALMNSAHGAGASGGTVLNARRQAHEGTDKFFGISVQEERELIMILTSEEKKPSIMGVIAEGYGLSSKAQGIVFSMPVKSIMSLSSLE